MDEDVVGQLSNITLDDCDEKRSMCNVCGRPAKVCYCRFLPKTRIPTKHRIMILQHPGELKRSLRTAPMLELGLEEGACKVFPCKKLPVKPSKDNKLESVRRRIEMETKDNVILLYPSKDAMSLNDYVGTLAPEQQVTVVILDGTWMQTRAMYASSPLLISLVKVRLNAPHVSEYVIRSQPADGCLSTLEAGALALSCLEDDESIYNRLVQPLRALCTFQLERGASTHEPRVSVPLDGSLITEKSSRRSRKYFKQLFKTNRMAVTSSGG